MNDTERAAKERVAFCQNCGRALSAEDVRNVGSAIYCEPCLITKVAAADQTAASPGASGSGGNPGAAYGFGGTTPGYGYRAAVPPPPVPPGTPNPGLAALLGLIPGVGAFYNGQYAKGVVHLVIFAILTSLADHNGLFGLFVAGWIFYQVIEAHHTARARRDGTPLPNPFGLNDIGERLGFGRAWPGGASSTATGASAAAAASETTVPPPPGSSGAPSAWEAGASYAPPTAAYAPPPSTAYGSYVPPAPSWGAPAESYGGIPPPAPPVAPFPPVSRASSRVPTGALFLIGLGVLFLIGNSGWINGFPFERLIPFLLIGIGVWLFVRKMTEMGAGLADDGTATYRYRLFRAARGPVWIVLVGVLFLLDSFNILSWGRSWPLFIIVGGLMTFFERAAYTSALPPQYGYVPPAAPTEASPVAPPPATAIVPSSSHDREGN